MCTVWGWSMHPGCPWLTFSGILQAQMYTNLLKQTLVYTHTLTYSHTDIPTPYPASKKRCRIVFPASVGNFRSICTRGQGTIGRQLSASMAYAIICMPSTPRTPTSPVSPFVCHLFLVRVVCLAPTSGRKWVKTFPQSEYRTYLSTWLLQRGGKLPSCKVVAERKICAVFVCLLACLTSLVFIARMCVCECLWAKKSRRAR